MVATPSTMLPLGTKAPSFSLPNVCTNQSIDLQTVDIHKGCLIAFVCNHCPYVIHLLDPLVRMSNEWVKKGIKVFLISSNDADKYPDDSPVKMRELAEKKQFQFPYLYDEDQSVALAYRAACTPDFFLFDSKLSLFYRGQFDDSRPGNQLEATGTELSLAVDSLLLNQPAPKVQKPSLGCNLKWKSGNEPEYFKPKK
ncbi:thioredoxin family protein [Candidatus Chordibacter forsetii]|uniref:thioredoxin family protein n=1 Tax=Candidatus Chordibacter forsetii TaxID=3381758 RepID=UPI003899A398